MDWFLYDNGLYHERVKLHIFSKTIKTLKYSGQTELNFFVMRYIKQFKGFRQVPISNLSAFSSEEGLAVDYCS